MGADGRKPARFSADVNLAWAIAVFASVLHGPVLAQPSEYSVKAAYLFNFINFTEWPPSAFEGPAAPLRICVVGADPFGVILDGALRGETVSGHPLAVERMGNAQRITECHVVFVPASVKEPAGVLSRLSRRPVLTVGESDAFWRAGGMIRFAIEGRNVRFDANSRAAEAAGLKLSARLMQVARSAT